MSTIALAGRPAAIRRARRFHWPSWRYYILVPVALFQTLPIVFLANHAFKPLEELFLYPPTFIVQRPVMTNFEQLLLAASALSVPFSRYMFNTAFITGVTVFGSILIGAMAAYPLAKHRAPGMNVLFTIVIAALMFSPHVVAIPRYLVVNRLGLIDTYWAMILVHIAGPTGLFLMRQFTQQVPNELIEAAKVDGASEWTIFWRVIMPNTQPAWATLAIFTFLSVWNDEFGPLIYTRSEAMRTLAVAMITIQGGAEVVARQGAAAAAAFLMTMPTIIVFLLMQRRVIQTMAHAGIKG
jgi:ABC-type glycerol-3-phosphate transport system permease component